MSVSVRRVCKYWRMARRGGAVHVVTTRRHYKDRVYETHLLRRTYREGGKVRNETVGNLSHLPAETIPPARRGRGAAGEGAAARAPPPARPSRRQGALAGARDDRAAGARARL